MNRQRKRGFLCTLGRLVRRLHCPHSRTFVFYPDGCYFHRDGQERGTMTHGAKLECCMDCGETWASDYAE